MQLRRFKRRIALLAGLADLGSVWPTEDVLHAMSVAADAALEQSTAFLFRKAREAGQIKPTAGEARRRPAISSSPWASLARMSSTSPPTST